MRGEARKGGGRLRIPSPAKVNLLLRVAGRRPDGYHELETVMQTLEFADTVELERIPSGVELVCDSAGVPSGPENLAWKAAEGFFAASGAPGGVRIVLHKRIPPGGGLAGGSSNAAAVLAGLQELYGTPLPPSDLASLAAGIGSDVAFFLQGGTCLCRGRGERVEPLPDPGPLFFVLLLPPFSCPTGEVYRRFRPSDSTPPAAFREALNRMLAGGEDPGAWLLNDLERAARRAVPELDRFMAEIEVAGLEGLRVSGSGSTLFRAFYREEEALRFRKKAAAALEGRHVGVLSTRRRAR